MNIFFNFKQLIFVKRLLVEFSRNSKLTIAYRTIALIDSLLFDRENSTCKMKYTHSRVSTNERIKRAFSYTDILRFECTQSE